MLFISRDKGRTFFLPHDEYEVIQTNSGAVTIKKPLQRIVFLPYNGKGFVTSALPVKHGRDRAEGYFNSGVAKTRPNVTQDEAEAFLMDHKDYGTDFVAIGDDGKSLTPLEWNSPAHRSEPFLTDSGEGKHCQLCKKQVDIRGLHKHIESKAHMALLAQAEKLVVSNLQGERV